MADETVIATRPQARTEFFTGLGALIAALLVVRMTPLGEALMGLGYLGPSLPLFAVAIGVIVWMRATGRPWASVGIKPVGWGRLVMVVLMALFAKLALGELFDAIAQTSDVLEGDGSRFSELEGNLRALITSLPLMWAMAAFGEEVLHRGFLLPRFAIMGGKTRMAWGLAIVVLAFGFGLGHAYQGPLGIASSALGAVIYSLAYLGAGRSIWAAVIVHGVANSLALYALYQGA